MPTYFEITAGLPRPLSRGALEMFFSEEGSGGRVGFAAAASPRHIIMIDNKTVAARFKAHLEQLKGVQFTHSNSAPRGVHLIILAIPSNEELIRALCEALGLG